MQKNISKYSRFTVYWQRKKNQFLDLFLRLFTTKSPDLTRTKPYLLTFCGIHEDTLIQHNGVCAKCTLDALRRNTPLPDTATTLTEVALQHTLPPQMNEKPGAYARRIEDAKKQISGGLPVIAPVTPLPEVNKPQYEVDTATLPALSKLAEMYHLKKPKIPQVN